MQVKSLRVWVRESQRREITTSDSRGPVAMVIEVARNRKELSIPF